MKKIIILLFVLFSFVGYAQSVTSVTKYRTGKLYPINELVSKDGVIYKALVSTTASPPSADWQDALSGGGAEADPIFIAWDKSSGILITQSQISDLTHTTDTDTHIDQTGVEAFGFVTGAHTTDTDTQLNQTQVGTFATAEGFIKTFSELDPVYSAWNKSTGISITESQISDLTHTTDTNTQLSQANVGTFATAEGFIKTFSELDPTYTSSQASNITAQNITDLGNLSNTNSGDQDISGITTNAGAITTLQTNNTGTNTGDQVLTDYAKKDEIDLTTNTGTGDYVISSANFGQILFLDRSIATNLTINTGLTTKIGQTFSVVQDGTGQLTINGTATMQSTSTTVKTLEEDSAIQFVYRGSDIWYAMGRIEDN